MTTTINFTWDIIEVGTMLKTMMIRYQRDKENEPPSFLHIAIPRKGETENLDNYIKSYAPIGAWLANDVNEVAEYEEIEIGKTGDHTWTNVVGQVISAKDELLTLDILKTRILTQLSTNRYLKETSGISYLGYNISTKREDVSSLYNLYTLLKTDSISTISYKTMSGEFLTLTMQNIEGLISVISHHIQMAFELEKDLRELIKNVISKEELQQININL